MRGEHRGVEPILEAIDGLIELLLSEPVTLARRLSAVAVAFVGGNAPSLRPNQGWAMGSRENAPAGAGRRKGRRTAEWALAPRWTAPATLAPRAWASGATACAAWLCAARACSRACRATPRVLAPKSSRRRTPTGQAAKGMQHDLTPFLFPLMTKSVGTVSFLLPYPTLP